MLPGKGRELCKQSGSTQMGAPTLHHSSILKATCAMLGVKCPREGCSCQRSPLGLGAHSGHPRETTQPRSSAQDRGKSPLGAATKCTQTREPPRILPATHWIQGLESKH